MAGCARGIDLSPPPPTLRGPIRRLGQAGIAPRALPSWLEARAPNLTGSTAVLAAMREIKIIGLYLKPFLLSLNPHLHHTASRCRMASYYRPALFRLGSGAGRNLWSALALVLFAINGTIYVTSLITHWA